MPASLFKGQDGWQGSSTWQAISNSECLTIWTFKILAQNMNLGISWKYYGNSSGQKDISKTGKPKLRKFVKISYSSPSTSNNSHWYHESSSIFFQTFTFYVLGFRTTSARYRDPGNLLAFEVDFITAELQHLNVLEEVKGCLVFNILPSFLFLSCFWIWLSNRDFLPFRISEFQSEQWRFSRRWGLVSCNWN